VLLKQRALGELQGAISGATGDDDEGFHARSKISAMGLGIGIDCELCGNQLRYDTDSGEIADCTAILESGEQIITRRPVLCARCLAVTQRIFWKLLRESLHETSTVPSPKKI
jgi:hypothetical protein